MELRTLKYFLTVAREENITEAANVLHLTQPTLSRQIADLEKELGVTLFRRTNRRTSLTEEGMHLRQRAAEILTLVSETEDEMRESWTDLSGWIRIGAAEAPTVRYLTDAFAHLHDQYPKVTCELSSGNADLIKYKLEHGLLDFALFLEPVKLEDCEILRLPEALPMGIVSSPTAPWAGKKAITPEDLRHIPLLLSSRSANPTNYNFQSWSGGSLSPRDLRSIGTFDLLGNASYLVEKGLACAVGIQGVFSASLATLTFIPFDPPMEITSVIAWKKRRVFTPTTEAYLRELKKIVDSG